MKRLFILFYGIVLSLLPAILQAVPTNATSCLYTYPSYPESDTLSYRMARQSYLFPQEKVHVQTDRSRYMGGDTIWLRAFVVDARTHQPVSVSRYLYIELKSPFDSLLCRTKIKELDGIYAGYVPLPTSVPEGDYTLCAYTLFMGNAGEEYFFKKNVYVDSPFALESMINADFDREESGALSVELAYCDRRTGLMLPYDEMKYATFGGKCYRRSKGSEKVKVKLKKEETRSGFLFVSFNNYQSYIRLSRDSGEYSVSLHPEGGYLIPDTPCRVAFKALSELGMGEDISGVLLDDKNTELLSFETQYAGMGFFTFIPRPDSHYRVLCRNRAGVERICSFPAVTPDATVLRVSYPDRRSFTVSVASSESSACSPLRLVIHQRGKLLYTGEWSAEKEFLYFKKQDFPPGVLQVLLLDHSGNTLSERMLFVRDYTSHKVECISDRPSYDSRQKVILNVALKGFTLPEGDYAVSVTDDHSVKPDTLSSIESNLLLASELCGNIEAPEYYFQKNDSYADIALDALLLTQGWRRYDVPSVLRGKYAEPSVPVEIGQEVSGSVRHLLTQRAYNSASISLLVPQFGYANSFMADSSGIFRCNGFDFPDSTLFVLQSFTGKGKPILNLRFHEADYPPTHIRLPFMPGLSPVVTPDEYMERQKQHYQSNGGIRSLLLDEVVITAKKKKVPEDIFEAMAFRSYHYEEMQRAGTTSLMEIVQRIPGIVIRNGIPFFRRRPVSFFVNGVFESFPEEASSGNLLLSESGIRVSEMEERIPFEIIKRVDFLRPSEAVVLGRSGTVGGALMITTKQGDDAYAAQQSPSLFYTLPLGYQKPAEFYSPHYDTRQQKEHPGYDMRNTIYWSPCVKLDDKGKSAVEFYTSDVSDTYYTVRIEGVTHSGEVFRSCCRLRKE